ncbi:MAG: hypothetical protein M3Y33_00490 [Actinomycetota bacterium]|nr:hypothetical protein [Actinomycetota bacterium]
MSESAEQEPGFIGYDAGTGLPVYQLSRTVSDSFEFAKLVRCCQRCKRSGIRAAQIPRSRVAGLRRAGEVGWRKVVLCGPCIELAGNSESHEVWDITREAV